MLLASSAVIEDIRASQRSEQASLGYFYCDFRDYKEGSQKDLRGLLSSLLVQLGEESDAYWAILYDFYADPDRGSEAAIDEKLLGCLKNMLERSGQATVYIIIDAIDECPTTDVPTPREKVLGFVEELVKLISPRLRICVTSRPEEDISSALDSLKEFCSVTHVSLERESGQAEDIAKYVEFYVNKDSKMKLWEEKDKRLVMEGLSEKADGM